MVTTLIAASTFFMVIHFLVAGTRLRDAVVARIGESRFRLLFAAMAITGLAAMIVGYRQAERIAIWSDDIVSLPVIFTGNLAAVLLLVIGTLTSSPNSILTEKAYRQGKVEVNGILRITRHPGMLGIGLWALMHLLANGDSASLVFFGALAVLALLGPLSMDRKKIRLEGERYRQIMAQTSYLPFMAILQGKNRLVWREIGWWKPVSGVAVFAGLVLLHPWIAGVAVV